MPWLVAAASFAALLGAPPASRTFEVPAACGDEASFAAHLEELGGAAMREERPAALRIDGPNAAGRYSLHLTMAHETRVLEDASCTTLLRSAAVIVAAAAADPDAPGAELPTTEPAPEPETSDGPELGVPTTVDPTEPPPPRPAETAEPAPPPITPPARTETPELRRTNTWTGGLGVGAGVAVGLVPRAGARLELVGDLAHEPWGIRFVAHVVPPARARDGEAVVEVMAAGARLAARVRLIRALHLALGAEVDWLRGRGVGVPDARTARLWMVSPLLELTAVPLDRARVRLEIGAVLRVATTRPRFELLGRGALYQVAPVSFLATIRGVWKIP